MKNSGMTHVVFGLALISLGIVGCASSGTFISTQNIPVVEPFDVQRYTGTWYEIARLPNRFERNLEQVTATYTLQADGKIQVVNKGFNAKKQKWDDITGRAWIPDQNTPSKLRVSFFWFVSSPYHVIALDREKYTYAMVTSNTTKYLWILSRTPQMDAAVYKQLVQQAKEQGFAVEQIEQVPQ